LRQNLFGTQGGVFLTARFVGVDDGGAEDAARAHVNFGVDGLSRQGTKPLRHELRLGPGAPHELRRHIDDAFKSQIQSTACLNCTPSILQGRCWALMVLVSRPVFLRL